MKTNVFTIFLLTYLNCESVLNARAEVSLAELAQCKEYRTYMHIYNDLFETKKLNIANASDENELLRMKFYVQADAAVYIILATDRPPQNREKDYEILIGAERNTFSVIGYKHSEPVSKKLTENTLSVWDPTPIEIIQTRGNGTEGKLTVNLIGVEEPHLEFDDTNRLEINAVGFASYGTGRAKWYYDCKSIGNEYITADDDREIDVGKQSRIAM